MISKETMFMVGQNCDEYRSKSALNMMSMTNLSESCDNCLNYVRGHCIKDMITAIEGKIKIN